MCQALDIYPNHRRSAPLRYELLWFRTVLARQIARFVIVLSAPWRSAVSGELQSPPYDSAVEERLISVGQWLLARSASTSIHRRQRRALGSVLGLPAGRQEQLPGGPRSRGTDSSPGSSST